jgi:hypothetical protein
MPWCLFADFTKSSCITGPQSRSDTLLFLLERLNESKFLKAMIK